MRPRRHPRAATGVSSGKRRKKRRQREFCQEVSVAAKSPGTLWPYSSAKDWRANTRLQSQNKDRSDRAMVTLNFTWGMPKGSS